MPHLEVQVIEARKLEAKDINGKSDPYVKLWIHGQEKQVEKTKKIKETLNPYWDEKFTFKLSEEELKDPWLVVEVYDWDRIGSDELIGAVVIHLGGLIQGLVKTRWYSLEACDQGEISIGLKAIDFGCSPQQYTAYPEQDPPLPGRPPTPKNYKRSKKTGKLKSINRAKKAAKKTGKSIVGGLKTVGEVITDV